MTTGAPSHLLDPALRQDVRYLTSILGEIIVQQEGENLFQRVEEIRKTAISTRSSKGKGLQRLRRLIANLPYGEAMKIARAFTVYFQLVNLAEEAQRVRRIRSYESAPGQQLTMSLEWTGKRLKELKVPQADFARALEEARMMPVLTAHPTEVRRRTTIEHLAEVAEALEEWHFSQDMPQRRKQADHRIRETLEILWASNESRRRKLKVSDEVSQTLLFAERTIWDMIPVFHDKFLAMARTLYPDWKQPIPPFLQFGSWVGADRDGNPSVTPEVTWETALTHRRAALIHYAQALEVLIRRFSQADNLVPVGKELLESLARDRKQLKEATKQLAQYEAAEVYRKKLSYMHTRLIRALNHKLHGYANPGEFQQDLEVVHRSLLEQKSTHVAKIFEDLILKVRTFGFRLLSLEFREHRDRILQAVAEMAPPPGAGKRKGSVLEMPESRRRAWLTGLLAQGAAPAAPASPLARDLMAQFETMRRIQQEVDPEMAGTYLVSMTRSPSDLLAVLVLAQWAGLTRLSADGQKTESRVDVVPLFETVTDLTRSEEMMKSLWKDPFYQQHLAARGSRQQVMLGYSDANKDGGYLAANWSLYQAQARLAKAAERWGIRLILFHGKGGTIDRGGGLSHRAILAQPNAAPGCRIKITEQGEVVAAKYSHPVIARRNVEQMVSGVFLANFDRQRGNPYTRRRERWEEMMRELAELSKKAYRALVFDDPDFIPYYAQATPIRVVLENPIAGTRPGARPEDAAGDKRKAIPLDRLRAIPWVFSWVQSRYMLSAWYGIGSAIETFCREHPDGMKELKEMAQQWPFARVLWENAEASLGKADLGIAGVYASGVRPISLRDKVFKQIQGEHNRTVRGVLEVTGHKTLLERQPILRDSIRLRNPYVDPLHILQVHALKELDKAASRRRKKAPQADWLELARLTIHGVAYGMKSTG